MYLIFDTETTGLPKNFNAPVSDTDNWTRCVQIAWQLHDEYGRLMEAENHLVRPDGFNIPFEAESIHGISTELAEEQGIPIREVIQKFSDVLRQAKFVVGHNVNFDINIMGAEFYRLGIENPLSEIPVLDTCTENTAQLCKIPGGRGGRFKLPTLSELHEYLFQESFVEAHNASADVEATTRSFLELIRRNVYQETELQAEPGYVARFIEENLEEIQLVGLKHLNLKAESDKIRKRHEELKRKEKPTRNEIQENIDALEEVPFAHLHNHSQYSVLQATSDITQLVDAAVSYGMPAVALTDIGNMMGAFRFVKTVNDHNKKIENSENHLKAIVGCEFYVCQNHLDKTRKDNGYQVVMLAKNKRGYHNLAKMSSIAYTKGFYYVPRIDREIIEQFKEDVIVLTGGIQGEVPNKILNVGEKQAEEALLWWKEQFGDDLYIEIQRHNQEDENRVNEVLIDFARRHQIKMVACNNTFYINKEDANAHDILLCVKEGEKQSTPIGRGRGYRYGLQNQEYYFKSQEEMKELFKDLPEAIVNIEEVISKIEPYTLARKVLLPNFDIPEDFINPEDETDGGKRGENSYLRYLTYKGAKQRYAEINEVDEEVLLNSETTDSISSEAVKIKERLDFELDIIARTGYPGYFLIVQDLIAEARKMGVSVGPGRGSAAGSAVAYCLGITNICPIKYDLLFERFLNPDRVSMPDIDIDFDDEGRSLVMDYVINKYGNNQVAQIITYGTMAAKSSIRDTARVLDLPLMDADRISKLIPTMGKLKKIFDLKDSELSSKFRADDLSNVMALRNIATSDSLEGQTISQARIIEGSVRNTGVHACGVIITPSDITDFVPVATAKDSDLYLTQFDNAVVENAGLLKMDFLGLKTLTHIKDAVALIKERHNIELNPDELPLDDELTYQLFQRGETVAIFQYESVGMQKYMRDLQPTSFPDLIAMNALYRPGPIEYIPSFIARKHGKEEITYDLPEMEEYLEETYGITVYQEQVMLLSQKLAGFTKGEADSLRKAMGKKLPDVLKTMKSKFINQAKEKGHDDKILEKIWKDWEAFAHYAFNKSHSTCYAWIAYQTAYLKAHYPAEFMAAVLSNSMNDIKEVSLLMEECRRMGIPILGPDVNESNYTFTVNDDNAIRFGMGAVKGVGRSAVETIVKNREKGKYTSVFDLSKRIDLRAANKRAFENLALAGGFDGFGADRAQYFHRDVEGVLFLEKILRYAAKFQENENSMQISLFGEASEVQFPEPEIPACESWGTMKKLHQEKEVVGLYISGHPLDDYKYTIKNFTTASLRQFKDLNELINRELQVAGIVSDVKHLEGRDGQGFGIFQLEDYEDSFEFRLYGEDYLKFRHFLVINTFIHTKVVVREGWVSRKTGKKGDPRINIQNIGLLKDVIDKQSKKLSIALPVTKIDDKMIDWLSLLINENSGNKNLEVQIFDSSEPQHSVALSSKKYRIDISPTLMNELEKKQIYFKLS